LCTDPLPNPLVDFLVDLAHRTVIGCVIGNDIGTARLIPGTETVKCAYSIQAGAGERPLLISPN
jgi:hypothetical protein